MTTPAQVAIARVVVMEDRAQVERRGTLAATGGLQKFELTGLSLVAVDRSLKVEVQGATLIDSKLTRRWREKPAGGLAIDASALQRRAWALRETLAADRDLVARLQGRLELLEQTRADLLRAMAELTAVGRPEIAVWSTQLDTLEQRQARALTELREAQQAEERTNRLLSEAHQAIATSEAKETSFECALSLTIEAAAAGEVSVKLSYLVPCAVWRPAYRATLQGETVLFEAEAVVWQYTGEAWSDVELAFSTARPTLGTTPPSLVEDRLHTRPKAAEEKRVVDVTIREEVIQTTGEPSSGAPELPGLDDGGEARLLLAPGKRSVPSDGQPHRVALSQFSAPAKLEKVCAAELTHLVSTVARFPNSSGQVLLAGPVDLIRSSGFVGRTQLSFAAPAETVKLSFGSEDGVQVTRDVEEKRDEARLTGRKTTKKLITLHVSNASRQPQRLVIEERVPVSEVKDVEVQVLVKECTPPPSPLTKEGIARIEVSLPPNGTQKIQFAWELSAASKVAGL